MDPVTTSVGASVMESIMKVNSAVNAFVWGAPVLILLVGTGVWLTILLGVPQLRYFFKMLKEVFSFRKNDTSKGKSITSFAAMATAMAATVGTGNIAGVATALHLGGPGALVWMLVSALFGMCTKFSEVALAVHFRARDKHGDWRGGTMYILEHGTEEALGHSWKWLGKILAVLFALFAFMASFGIGAATQSNSAAEAISMGWGIDHLWTGIMLAIVVGFVIIGGLNRLSLVTTYVVPFMAVFYIIASIIVLVQNSAMLPEVIKNAFKLAVNNPETMPAGIAGWCVKEAVQRGIARGVFSNEAGMGSAPMVHATADIDHPINQGMYGIFEVFMDTILICTMTSLVIMSTGTLTSSPDLTGAQLSLQAFENALGPIFGKYVLSIALLLFAFTTILGWYWYAETALVYLFGVWAKPIMKILWIVMILIGAAGSQFVGAAGNEFLNNIWDISDTLNGLMALPNLIGLLLMSFTLRRLVKDYDSGKANWKLGTDQVRRDAAKL